MKSKPKTEAEDFGSYYRRGPERKKAIAFYNYVVAIHNDFDGEPQRLSLNWVTYAKMNRLLNIDAALLPKPMSWWLDYDVMPAPGVHICPDIIIGKNKNSIRYFVTLNDAEVVKANINIFKLMKIAAGSSKRFGLKADLYGIPISASSEEVFCAFVYPIPAKGNLLDYYNRGLKKVRQLFTYSKKKIWAEVRKDLRRAV